MSVPPGCIKPRLSLGENPLMSTVPICRIVTVHTFLGDRTSDFTQGFFESLEDERNDRGPGPSRIDCLLFAGHTGLSTDSETLVYGFNPDAGTDPTWRVMQRLR